MTTSATKEGTDSPWHDAATEIHETFTLDTFNFISQL